MRHFIEVYDVRHLAVRTENRHTTPVSPAPGNIHIHENVAFTFFVFELGAHTGQTDGQTDGRTDGRTGKTRYATYET